MFGKLVIYDGRQQKNSRYSIIQVVLQWTKTCFYDLIGFSKLLVIFALIIEAYFQIFNETMNQWIIPLHNWYNTIAKEFLLSFPDLAPTSLAPASDFHVFLDCTQNHESK